MRRAEVDARMIFCLFSECTEEYSGEEAYKATSLQHCLSQNVRIRQEKQGSLISRGHTTATDTEPETTFCQEELALSSRCALIYISLHEANDIGLSGVVYLWVLSRWPSYTGRLLRPLALTTPGDALIGEGGEWWRGGRSWPQHETSREAGPETRDY